MSDNPAIKAKVAAYLLLKNEIEHLKRSQDSIKQELVPYLDDAGTNARGSYVIPFSEPLEVGGTKYASLQRVRKESKVLNEERVIDFLMERANDPRNHPDMWQSPIVTVQHVDQDVLWDLFARDLITQEELDSFFDVSVTWAFSPTKL